MSRIRAVLHHCADLIADALEEEIAAKASEPKKRQPRRPERHAPPAAAPELDEFTRRRAVANCRRFGIPVPATLLQPATKTGGGVAQ